MLVVEFSPPFCVKKSTQYWAPSVCSNDSFQFLLGVYWISANVVILHIFDLLVIRCYEDMPLQELQATQEQQTIQNLSDTLRTILRL